MALPVFQLRSLSEDQRAFHVARRHMIEQQLRSRKVTDPRVLTVMEALPRHMFVDQGMWEQAYLDRPLTIGQGQTISQPFIVGFMTQALQLTGTEKILEIGTGCGYQTAVLCMLANKIFSIERLSDLSNRARKTLYQLGLTNFQLRIGDGTLGWPDAAPFDAIIVTAGGPEIPQTYLDQLADGGRLVIPVGRAEEQQLVRVTKQGTQLTREVLTECRFVPLIGKLGWQE